jgi:hypothetical protein
MTRVRAYLVLGIGAALLAVVVLLLTAPARTPAPTDGCEQGQATELYVQQAYTCGDGTQVLTFTDVTQRDNYTEVATQYGVIIIDRGDAWVRIRRV